MGRKRGRDGMEGVPTVTYAERYGQAQDFYTEARRGGVCRLCGKGGYVEIGRHPGGRRGQPVKVLGPDIEGIREWIREAGWMCASCKRRSTTTTTTGSWGIGRREELAALRKKVAPLLKGGQTPETCQIALVKSLAYRGPGGRAELQELADRGECLWMDPDEFAAALARIEELKP